MMGRTRISVSLPAELVAYLRSTPNASSVVSEAVREYRAEELRRELAEGYVQDRDEAAEIDREWSAIDATVPE